MSLKLGRRELIIGAAASTLILPMRPAFAEAATHEIQMLNKHPEDRKQRMVFYPQIQQLNVGDTVTFLSADKGHNCASIDGMLPADVEEWSSKINDDFSFTIEKAGFYGYKCTPHASVGMVGLLIVEGEGKMDNYEDAKSVKHRGKSRGVWKGIWETVEADGLATA
ncbi:pseudoazurin [Roseobacteraceae bacterium S113]